MKVFLWVIPIVLLTGCRNVGEEVSYHMNLNFSRNTMNVWDISVRYRDEYDDLRAEMVETLRLENEAAEQQGLPFDECSYNSWIREKRERLYQLAVLHERWWRRGNLDIARRTGPVPPYEDGIIPKMTSIRRKGLRDSDYQIEQLWLLRGRCGWDNY